MNKVFLLGVLLLFNFTTVMSQTTLSRTGGGGDTLQSAPKNKVAKIEQYLIIDKNRDTTFVDSTLSLKKDYKFNYLRRDNFGLLPFANLGQTYNSLTHDYKTNRSLPVFGARAKHFNYMEIEDMRYYHVPTPLSEMMYKTAFEQGQLLDAFFTINTSKQFNFSIAYKGLRSLGKYQHALTSTGNFRFTTSYSTKNNRYQARAHVVMQDILNEENGGLTDVDVANFESGDPEFIDRSVFAPNFEDAENSLEGKRFLLDHQYNLLKPSDSASNSISVGQVISFEDKFYQYTQATRNDFFGASFLGSAIKDRVTLEEFSNQFFVQYKNKTLGALQFNADYANYNYGYDALTVIDGQQITNRLKGSVLGIGGKYQNTIGWFHLNGEFGLNVSGDFNGNFLDLNASYKLSPDVNVMARLNTSSKQANYNMLLYQSDYLNYNWDNSDAFKNVQTQNLAFKIQSDRFASAGVELTSITNYTYFGHDANNAIKPLQTDQSLKYLKIDLSKEFKVGKFALDNTILYQNVLDGEGILNVPQIITRNTLYFSDHVFKKALFLQTGITLNYFTNYKMDAYDPLLGEFYVQNTTDIGNFPRLDFFINAKVRQTRIFIKAEHFNSAFTGYNYFSAPNNPYRDFTIRFGLVWNFFL